MHKATPILLLILVMSSASAYLISLEPVRASPSTINVPNDFATIQMAINNANVNDTILVAAGTYNENIVINKTVALSGSGENVTFIRAASGAKAAIEIQANNVNLTGFTIRSGLIGVHLNLSHSDNIADNAILLNTFEGIFLQNSTHNLIHNNIVTKNAYTGIDLLFADQNRISNNTISFHANVTLHNQGVWMDSSRNNTIDGNIFLNNAYNIEMIEAANNTFYSNIVSFGYHGVELDVSDDNTFYHNNFLNNTLQVSSHMSLNTWDNRSLLRGNYWSDYREKYPSATEVDASGVWDTPYVIDADNNDTYPLVEPWSPPPVSDITPPVTTDDYDGLWHNHEFVVTLAAGDFGGVNETYYRVNDAPAVSIVTASGQPLITMESANNTLEYWSIDRVGNEESHKMLTGIKLDKTPPHGSIIIDDNDAYSTSHVVRLTLFGNDSLSGISQMRFSNNGLEWSPWEGYVTAKVWGMSPGDGLKTVYAQFSDNAGMASQTYNDTILLDTTPPTLIVESPVQDSVVKSSQVTVEWIGVDIGVGIDYYEVKLDSGSWINVGVVENYTFTGLSDGTHSVYIRGFDRLVHAGEVSVSFLVNTSLIGGPGYFEEAVVVVIVVVVIAVAVFLFWFRKRRMKKT